MTYLQTVERLLEAARSLGPCGALVSIRELKALCSDIDGLDQLILDLQELELAWLHAHCHPAQIEDLSTVVYAEDHEHMHGSGVYYVGLVLREEAWSE